MLNKTDLYGNIGTTDAYPLGPYFTSFPQNPYNGRNDVKVVGETDPMTPDDSTGWIYRVDSSSRFFIVCNSTRLDTSGRPIFSY